MWERACKTYMYICLIESRRPKIKVGISWRVDLRVRQLGYGRRKKPVLLGYSAFEDEYSARKAEYEFHQFASEGKYRGEWHDFTPKLVTHFFEKHRGVLCL